VKILFNASGCGLANNGGSKTIIKSAETLKVMGHNVAIWAPTNHYTWHKPDVEIGLLVKYNRKYICYYETIINVSVWDVDSTLKMPIDNKVWWLRGYEKWVRGEDWLISQIKKFVNAGGKMIVNSSWLIGQLKEKCGVDSELCFAGLDLDFWERNLDIDGGAIGSIGRSKHMTKNYGLCKTMDRSFPNRTWQYIDGCLNNDQLYRFYNNCDIWFAPTALEGFHQCPAEANLCGCLVVCNREDSNGMGDYATDETAMRYDYRDGPGAILMCIINSDFDKVEKMQEVLKTKIGNRETNMKKFVEMIG
jgi:hypothetical protein